MIVRQPELLAQRTDRKNTVDKDAEMEKKEAEFLAHDTKDSALLVCVKGEEKEAVCSRVSIGKIIICRSLRTEHRVRPKMQNTRQDSSHSCTN